ncbi:MAG: NAD-dependent DNA ligase LigA [Planctomycetia bacterium]|nr:NAD-dependent DNA ligase LigA [Planctomycetia bacterium]
MTQDEARLEIERLTAEIRRCDQLYYVENTPDIPDHEYDYLMRNLKRLEAEFPELIDPDSPTQRIGDKIVGRAEVVEHKVPMLSIENVYTEEELFEFVESAQKLVSEPLQWVCELKIDGVAATLIYEKRRLVRALTRGDGRFGEDVTANARTIRDIPLTLPMEAPEYLEARGEVYMTNENLARLNALAYQESRQKGKEFKPYANTRNLTSGTLKQLDPAVCAQRRLRFFVHSTGSDPQVLADNHFDFLAKLRSFGFATAPLTTKAANLDAAVATARQMQERLHELDFEVDGIVLKVDSFQTRERIGSTSKYPKWIVACKFEKYEATTTIRDIVVQVGKSGVITPVAELEPVTIAGTVVSRASLHNKSEIQAKDIRLGDTVVVEKAGKIIPHIVRVEKYARPQSVEPPEYEFPTVCPSCGGPLKQSADGPLVRCIDPECPAQFREKLAYFASKEAMDVDGVGDVMVEKLLAPRNIDLLLTQPPLVSSFADLYRLTVADLLTLPGVKQKSAQNLIEALEASKSRGPARVLAALSIPGIGAQSAKAIIKRFRSFDRLMAIDSIEPYLEVDGVGAVLAQNLLDFFRSSEGRRIVTELQGLGLTMALPELEAPQDARALPLLGKTICVTGTLLGYDRVGIKEAIEEHGGKAVQSVSKKLTWLLVGDAPGATKLEKAEKLGVPILSEEEFNGIISGTSQLEQPAPQGTRELTSSDLRQASASANQDRQQSLF